MNALIVLVALAGLVSGSITDIRKREVPDLINYGLIFAGVGLNIIFSVVAWDARFIISSILGLGIFYLFALVMYYTAQWGGGDSKMIMGIGALVGVPVMWPVSDSLMQWLRDPYHGLPFMAYFVIFTMLSGSLYGLVWSAVVSLMRWKDFKADFLGRLRSAPVRYIKLALVLIAGIAIIIAFMLDDIILRLSVLAVGVLIVLTFYLFIYIRSVEKVCMQKYIRPSELTEGDWIVEDVRYKGRRITGPKDLGIRKEQIEELKKLEVQGKINKVLIKEGIPFVPSFLAGFIAVLLYL